MGVTQSIDVTSDQKKIIHDLLKRYLPNTTIWVYGSRVKWTARPNSDLDMVAFVSTKQHTQFYNLKEAFEESDLPFKVDFFIWDEVPEQFHKNIKSKYVVLQEKPEVQSDWVEASLGDFVDHQKGFIFKSKDYQDEGELIVRVSDFTDRSIDVTSCNRIDESRADEFQKVRLNWLDVIIATVGSWPKNPASIVGKTICVPKEADGALLNQNAVRFRATNGMDQRFLFCLLKTKDFQNYIVSTAQGSANQASITLKDIFRFTFNLPNPTEQKAIAHILGSLDDKIELNRQMNETLEAMAQALFKSWFVDFDPVIDNAIAAGNAIPDVFAERAEQRKENMASRGIAETMLERSDDSPQGEVFIHEKEKPHKSGGVAFKDSNNTESESNVINQLFPDAFEYTDEMGCIPKGWTKTQIKDIAYVVIGKSYKSIDL